MPSAARGGTIVPQPRYRDLGIGMTGGTPFPSGDPGTTYCAVFAARAQR